MKPKKQRFVLVLILCGLSAAVIGVGFAENIDPNNDGSQYAWSENVGWLNAEPLGDGGRGIVVKDSKLTGWIWGENIGWISLACDNTATCSTNGGSSYRVVNNCEGGLSGFAWAENVGWINFGSKPAGVTISPTTGEFNGYAWGENVGWISFGHAQVAYRIRTSWRPSTTVPAGSPNLLLHQEAGTTLLSWDDPPDAGWYDVVRGDLGILRATSGDFTAATLECLGNNQVDFGLSFSGVPSAGQGFWFVVRPVNCAGNGTYNSIGSGQVGNRDFEICASPNACTTCS